MIPFDKDYTTQKHEYKCHMLNLEYVSFPPLAKWEFAYISNWLVEHLEKEFEVEVEGEPIPPPETSPSEVVAEGPQKGAPIGFAANCNILIEEPDSPPHQGKPQCICHLITILKTFITYMLH
jgi:hypothetical protein